MSLDTSSTVSGWAFFIDGKYKKSGIINRKSIKDTEKRTMDMCIGLFEVIHKYNPSAIVIEQLPSTRNVQTTRLLSKIIGAVYCYTIINGIKYVEMSCNKWRKIVGVTTKKKEDAKSASINRVFEKYKLDVDDNEADAINIGDAFCALIKLE